MAAQESRFRLDWDLAVIAVGSRADLLLTRSTKQISLNRWGCIVADPQTGKTAIKGVWAGGGIVTGAATIKPAMGAGRKAADSIHDYLNLGWQL